MQGCSISTHTGDEGQWCNSMKKTMKKINFSKRNLGRTPLYHYNDVIKGTIASQITSLTIVYSIVYSDADQRKHQSSASLAFVRGIHRGPVNSPHKWPATRKCFQLIMSSWSQAFCAATGEENLTHWGLMIWRIQNKNRKCVSQKVFNSKISISDLFFECGSEGW